MCLRSILPINTNMNLSCQLKNLDEHLKKNAKQIQFSFALENTTNFNLKKKLSV